MKAIIAGSVVAGVISWLSPFPYATEFFAVGFVSSVAGYYLANRKDNSTTLYLSKRRYSFEEIAERFGLTVETVFLLHVHAPTRSQDNFEKHYLALRKALNDKVLKKAKPLHLQPVYQ
ncbi:hypothetical protein V5H08_12110 [Vibrio cholerae]|uniref:hypothetical protein n=1 Tax=Vibrio cholerae TaxID=666 RepID=UPI002F37D8C7|nr:hypothetical protein [Vibrio cholerae]EJL6307305.1 hypothetical protein [Vibrio cholerae]EJL6419663.1 hypothetical protein [Vibrio cholerae]EJL6582292.1 hypothetical protein [Vibrio cholerae]EKF9121564.1 hypothetical protein [Vibrio cholerae]